MIGDFFSHGEMKYRNLEPEIHSVKPFQVRHPKSPTKPPNDIPNLLPGEIVSGFAWLCGAVWLGEWTQFSLHVRYAFLQSAWEFETKHLHTREGSLTAGRSKKIPLSKLSFSAAKEDLPVLHGIFFRRFIWTYLGSVYREIGQVSRWIGGWHLNQMLVEVKNSSRNTDGNQV